MHDVTIRCRADGVIELRPRLAPLAPVYRVIVIGTVLLVTGGFFISGAVPPKVAAALAGSCLAGDLVLAFKSLLLHLRPLAPVVEVASFARRRRAAGR
jgi:hypothetical protein